jgi:hypothetical protein
MWHSIQHFQSAIVDRQPGASATLKVTCASEGWGVWTDDHHRIVGLCVAYKVGRPVSDRLADFVVRHAPGPDRWRVSDFIQKDTMDASTDGWRWFVDPKPEMVPQPPSMGRRQACFEVRLPR